MQHWLNVIKQHLSGLILVLLVTLGAFALNREVSFLEPVAFALVIGIVINNIMSLPEHVNIGIRFSSKTLLQLGIVCLGARLSLQSLASVSLSALWLSAICVVATLLVTFWLGRRMRVSKPITYLLAVGSSICGTAAIMAVAPLIVAAEVDVGAVIAVITLLGSIGIFVLPAVINALHLTALQAGFWAGLSLPAVPQVIAAGFAVSKAAGVIATTTKLVRVLLLAPMILAISVWQQKKSEQALSGGWQRYVPPFIIGFLLVVVLNSFGLIPSSLQLPRVSMFFITMAMAALGLKIHIKKLIAVGHKPLLLGSLALLFLLLLSYGLSI